MPVILNTAAQMCIEIMHREIRERFEVVDAIHRGEWPDRAAQMERGLAEAEVFTQDQADEAAIVRVLTFRHATCPRAAMGERFLRDETGLSRDRFRRARKRLEDRGRVRTVEGCGTYLRSDV